MAARDDAAAARGPSSPGSGARTGFILVTVFLDTLGIGLIVPVGPRLVAGFLHDDLASASRALGVLFALYAVMQFVAAPILGGLSDRFGRRPMILLALFGSAGSYLVSALAPGLGWLYAGRAVSGITGASYSAAGAYIADVTPPERRAASFGFVGAAFGSGFILGPAIGGVLGDVGVRIPYFVAAALNFANLLYGIFVLPESLRPEARRPFSIARANPLGSLRALARHRVVRGLSATMFCGFLAQMILQSVWAISSQGRFGWSARDVGLSLMVVGVATALAQGVLVRPVTARLGEKRVLVVSLAIGATVHAACGLATEGWMLLALVPFMALGGLSGPAVQAMCTREVGASEQGELQGSLNSLSGVAAIIGPLIGTSLYAQFGPETARPHVPGAPFFATAASLVVGLFLALRLFARDAVAKDGVAQGARAQDKR